MIDADPALVTELLQRLTAQLAAEGALRSPEWRTAFERAPRHRFVPCFYRRTSSGRELVDGARQEQHQEWLAGVYSNDALVAQYDPEDRRIATSSSTQPALMALMLEALDVRDGHCALEIGVGTGYNAALLCARLGSALVTTIDIDPAWSRPHVTGCDSCATHRLSRSRTARRATRRTPLRPDHRHLRGHAHPTRLDRPDPPGGPHPHEPVRWLG